MDIRSAVFVDLSTLNVMFKQRDKFVLALNFSDGLERLAELMQALGTGYDIYLCLKPRQVGEGDIEVPEISISGAPFIADSRELFKALSFFRESAGVSEVYLCNWLANYIASARVPSFESVVYYGTRVAHIKVSERMLSKLSIYPSQADFETSIDGDYEGYGDVGLVDTDGLVAKYPEFRKVSQAQITALAPLIQCYKTSLKVPTADLFEKVKAKVEGLEYAEPSTPEEPAAVVDVNTTPQDDKWPDPPKLYPEKRESGEDTTPKKIKPKAPIAAKGLFAASCVLALACGVCARLILTGPTNTVHNTYYAAADARIAALQSMTDVYSGAMDKLSELKEIYAYINASDLAVTVVGFDIQPNGNEVRCACASQDIANAFRDYIAENYVVSSMNDLGTSTDEQGNETRVFSVMFSG